MKTKIILILGLLTLGTVTMADSFIRVINKSNFPVTAIWQAGGCSRMESDPDGGNQFTVCYSATIDAGRENRYTFGMFDFDRSVKVWGVNGGDRIGYCNSMDSSSITISGTTADNQKVSATSGC